MELENLWQSLNIVSGDRAWISQAFLVVFLSLLAAFIQKIVFEKLHARLQKTANRWDDAVLEALRQPLTVLIWIVGIALAAHIAGQKTESSLFHAVAPARDMGIVTCFAWFLIRLVKRGQEVVVASRRAKGREIDLTTADAVSKLLRISVIITAVLAGLQTMGVSVSGVLAFGGMGGIVVGLAAKDLLANFFGGLMIFLDRPFAVGDWVRSPDRSIEGTVEDIGWRLTRIRTFDQRPLYVPNSTFSTIAVENPSRMSHRRIFETIGVRYDDADRLTAILNDVRAMLAEHQDIDQSQLTMVYFNAYAASSLDFFIYCFTKTTIWKEYHRVKEDVLLEIMRIVVRNGAQIAFPTTTVHVPDGICLQNLPELGAK